ncbi:MAG: peptidase MA family metallohydrolase, partial [Myxococcota bacterium]
MMARRTMVLVLLSVTLVGRTTFGASDGDAEAARGLALLEAWQLAPAKTLAQELLARSPEEPTSWYLAGRVQHERGEHLSALRLLAAAAEGGIEPHGELFERVRGSAEYAVDFAELETAHFRLRYLDKDIVLASYAGPVLEAAYAHIGGALGLLPAERTDKIVVEIYPDARGLAAATGLTVQEIDTSGTIAVCKFHRLMITSPLATASGYDWADTLAHELTHLIISQKSHNGVPIWLHEGIAKYYESLWRGEAGTALAPYSERLLAQAVKRNKLITFAQMHPSMAKLPSQEDAALAFAEVFTVIEYLRAQYGVGSIPKLLDLIGEGRSVEASLVAVFGHDLSRLETAWRRYLKRRKFRDVPGAAPRPIRLVDAEPVGNTPHLETIEDKDVHKHARLGELLELREHPEAAVREYEQAYARAGARYPTLLYRLIGAYLETQQAAAARKVVTVALGAHPDDGDLKMLAGRVALLGQDLPAAKSFFEAARLQNPYNPELHEALVALYTREGESAKAAEEQRWLSLCRTPRPRRDRPRIDAPDGTPSVSLTSVPWGKVRLDGGPPAVLPLWREPVAAGRHVVELLRPDGTSKA